MLHASSRWTLDNIAWWPASAHACTFCSCWGNLCFCNKWTCTFWVLEKPVVRRAFSFVFHVCEFNRFLRDSQFFAWPFNPIGKVGAHPTCPCAYPLHRLQDSGMSLIHQGSLRSCSRLNKVRNGPPWCPLASLQQVQAKWPWQMLC